MSEIEQEIMGLSLAATKDNREMVIRHLVSEPGEVVLNEVQKKLLERWDFCDNLIRGGRFTKREIEGLLKNKFKVSMATARRDYYDTGVVYGSQIPSNKKYLLGVHAEMIREEMIAAKREGDRKGFAALSREYTNAILNMPEDKGNNKMPQTFIYIQQNNINAVIPGGMTVEEAEAIVLDKLGEI